MGPLRSGDAGGTPDRLAARSGSSQGVRPRPRRRAGSPSRWRGRAAAKASTQEAVGRILLDLSRLDGLAQRIVTISPDVSVSTNLGGWINKVGVFGPAEEPEYEGPETSALAWRGRRQGATSSWASRR